ncbi:unnamed protein product [Spirodela intermedia]|uniref:Uncharacterized protein n=2 Tax=Spirodela intermedia TaxID=51605 RepID=A0A7I8JL10_SPIIN|nr:unnamed protein product [Spirodela intermedia]CAA6670866.1 unnamed protein product [Spirodela intermedia]CAA7407962.1 unnamed protein product [Spirodela intermedia]
MVYYRLILFNLKSWHYYEYELRHVSFN